VLLDAYAEHLTVRRGPAAETVRCYCNTARAFLGDRERIAGNLALEALAQLDSSRLVGRVG
jgi:hypothetical protein